jgi:hypothetical protein
MTKPKTGKTIMTDEEIIAQARLEMENGDAEDYDVYERILIGVARQQGIAEERQRGMRIWQSTVLQAEKREARAEGVAQGRALEDSECHQAILDSHEREKRAYANGFKEGEIKGLSESITVKGKSHLSYYQQGYALGQSDLKARLLSKEVIDNVSDSFMTSSVVKSFVKRAIKEAERK